MILAMRKLDHDQIKLYVIIVSVAFLAITVGYPFLTRIVQPNEIVVMPSGEVVGWINRARADYKGFWESQLKLVDKKYHYWMSLPEIYRNQENYMDMLFAKHGVTHEEVRASILDQMPPDLFDKIEEAQKENARLYALQKEKEKLEDEIEFEQMMVERKREMAELERIKEIIKAELRRWR